MSLRKMFRVSLFVLLAMTLAATGGHARLDLFGLLTSQNQPNPTKSEWIPYLECIQICENCVCDRRVPELAMCTCADDYKKPAAPLHSSAEKVQVQAAEELYRELDLVSSPVAKLLDGAMPYPECIKKCDVCVACTKIYPIELAWCFCGNETDSNSKKPAIQNSGGDKQLVLWTDAKLEPMSYDECASTCEGICACTLPWPPEGAICVCTASIKREAASKVLPAAQEVAKVKSKVIPYEECQKTCKSACACTLIWPPEASVCVCGDDDSIKIKSSTAKAAGDDTKMVLWTKAKLHSISYKECTRTCGECACTKPLTLVSPAACMCLSPKAAGRAISI